MGVPVAGFAVVLVLVVVFVPLVGEQVDPLGAVDDRGGGLGQRIGHKVLQPHAVHHDDIGALDGLHIIDGEGVVVETGNLILDQQIHLDVLHVFGDGGGEEIDGICGG